MKNIFLKKFLCIVLAIIVLLSQVFVCFSKEDIESINNSENNLNIENLLSDGEKTVDELNENSKQIVNEKITENDYSKKEVDELLDDKNEEQYVEEPEEDEDNNVKKFENCENDEIIDNVSDNEIIEKDNDLDEDCNLDDNKINNTSDIENEEIEENENTEEQKDDNIKCNNKENDNYNLDEDNDLDNEGTNDEEKKNENLNLQIETENEETEENGKTEEQENENIENDEKKESDNNNLDDDNYLDSENTNNISDIDGENNKNTNDEEKKSEISNLQIEAEKEETEEDEKTEEQENENIESNENKEKDNYNVDKNSDLDNENKNHISDIDDENNKYTNEEEKKSEISKTQIASENVETEKQEDKNEKSNVLVEEIIEKKNDTKILKVDVASPSEVIDSDVYVDPPYQPFHLKKMPDLSKIPNLPKIPNIPNLPKMPKINMTNNDEEIYVEGSVILLIDGGVENLKNEIENKNLSSKDYLLEILDNARLITVFDDEEYEEIVEVKVQNSDKFIEIVKNYSFVISAEKNKVVKNNSIIQDINLIEDLTYTQYSSRDEDETGFALFDKIDRTNFGGMRVDNWNEYNGNLPNPVVDTKDVVVAIIDTGCDINHPDLKNVLYDMSGYTQLNAKYGSGKNGYNAVAFEEGNMDKTDEMFDDVGHGTHCAGIIAAEWNKHGVSGVASGVKILPVKFSQMISIYKGFSYLIDAKKAGVPIVALSNSWASFTNNLIIERYVKKLGEMGVVTLFASGNEEYDYDFTNGGDIGYAIGNPYKIIVNASESSGKPVLKETTGIWGSNYGIRSTDLYAPGNNIVSTYPIDMSTPDLLFETTKSYEYEPGKYFEECFDGGSDVVGHETGIVKDNYLYKGDNFDISLSCAFGEPMMQTDAKETVKNFGYYEEGQYIGSDERKTGGLKLVYENEDAMSIKTLIIEDKYNKMDVSNKYMSFLIKYENMTSDKQAVFILFPTIVNENGEGIEIKNAPPIIPTNYYGWSTVSFDLRSVDASMLTGGKKLAITIIGMSPNKTYPNILIDKFSLVEDVLPYKFLSGTSMACPNAAGVVANVYSKYLENGYSISSDTASKVVATVMSTTRSLEQKYKDLCRTGGIIDLKNALNSIDDNSKVTPYIRTLEEFYQSDGRIKLDIRGEFLDKVNELYLSEPKNFNINTSYKITNWTSVNGEETTHIVAYINKNDISKVKYGEIEARVVNANGWTRTFFVHDKQKINLYKDIEISNVEDVGNKNMVYSMFTLNKKNYMVLLNIENDDITTVSEYNIVELKPNGENQCSFEEAYKCKIKGDMYTLTVYNKKLLCFIKTKDNKLEICEIDLEKKNCVIKNINTKYKDASDFYILNTGKYLLLLYIYKDSMGYTDVYLSFLEDNGTNGYSDGKVYKLNNIVTNLFVDNNNNIYGYNNTDTSSINTNIIKFSIDRNNELKEDIFNITLNDSGIKKKQEFKKCIVNLDDKFVMLGPVVVNDTSDEILCDNYFVRYDDFNKNVEKVNITKNSSIVSKTKMFNIFANANQNKLYIYAMAENYDADSKGYIYKVLQLDKNVINPGDKIFVPTYPGKKNNNGNSSGGGGGGSQEHISALDKMIEKEMGLNGNIKVSTSGIWQKTPNNTYIYIDEKGEVVKSKWQAIAWKTWKDTPNSSAYDWYYFDESGNMKTGWFMDKDNYIYYFDTKKENEGAMLVGKHLINGIYYYFSDGSTGLPKGALDASVQFGY